jgi:hypothetical protein
MRVTTDIRRVIVLLAVTASLSTACGSGKDTSPTVSPALTAETAVAVQLTPIPGDKPGSSPTTDPQNPFHFSGPPGSLENLAGAPGLADLPPETDIDKILVQIPATHLLAPADLARFKLTAARGTQNSGGFSSVTYYSDDAQRQTLSVGAWNKVGDFNVVVVLNSPVNDYKLTNIDGLPAFTILPSANVVGGAGPRTAYLYYQGVIYAIHGEGFASDPGDSFMSLVHNFIGELKK